MCDVLRPSAQSPLAGHLTQRMAGRDVTAGRAGVTERHTSPSTHIRDHGSPDDEPTTKGAVTTYDARDAGPSDAGARRVLHVAHNALPHIGGLETVVAAETRGLVARGWRVTLVTSAGAVPPGERDEDGVHTVRVRAWNGLEARFGVPFPVFSARLLLATGRQVRRADVVHVHDTLYLTSWVATLWCLLLRTPYVVHRHVGFVHHSSVLVRVVQRVVLGTLARVVLRHAETILPIDEAIATGLRATVPDPARVEVLGNGVDTAHFRPVRPGGARSRPGRARPAAGPAAGPVRRQVRPQEGLRPGRRGGRRRATTSSSSAGSDLPASATHACTSWGRSRLPRCRGSTGAPT